jgi:hypothetical protein
MKKQTSFVVISALLVMFAMGCTGRKYQWYQAGVIPAQVSRDCRECLKKAEFRRHVENYDESLESRMYDTQFQARIDNDFDQLRRDFSDDREEYSLKRCMTDKGYKWKLIEY